MSNFHSLIYFVIQCTIAPLKLKFFSFINVLDVVDIPSIGQLGYCRCLQSIWLHQVHVDVEFGIQECCVASQVLSLDPLPKLKLIEKKKKMKN
jgi:hypothetical protein